MVFASCASPRDCRRGRRGNRRLRAPDRSAREDAAAERHRDVPRGHHSEMERTGQEGRLEELILFWQVCAVLMFDGNRHAM